MTDPADIVLTNAEGHTLADPDETFEAVAVRDGGIVRVGSSYEVGFLTGVDTRVVDLGGRVLLPGFVDAHTHLPMVGRRLVDADLSTAAGPEGAVDLLREAAGVHDDWILGFGYDESAWAEARYLRRSDLDRVSEDRPVAAFREDMHVASLNGTALDRLADSLPVADVRREGGEPTGVVVEEAALAVFEAVEPSPAETREYVLAARDRAHERGVTAVHDMVRRSHAPRVYRELDRAGELALRVRLNYWRDHLDAAVETGLATNHGSEFVRVGAIKTFADGSIGGRTAKLSVPYADGEDARSDGNTGQWVLPPEDLRAFVERADDAGYQVAVHAIGDAAVGEALDALAAADADRRHRIEHAEVLTDDLIDRLGAADVVVSAQPNFLKWAGEGGLYDARLGPERRRATNRFGALREAGARLAFGSDCMPLDPLFGVDRAVNAPTDEQRLPVTEALRAYTAGGAYAGFDEDRLGTVAVGKRGDFVALSASPWETDDVAGIDVELTVVDGDVVYDGRE